MRSTWIICRPLLAIGILLGGSMFAGSMLGCGDAAPVQPTVKAAPPRGGNGAVATGGTPTTTPTTGGTATTGTPTGGAGSAPVATSKTINTAYISKNFIAAAVVHPQRAYNSRLSKAVQKIVQELHPDESPDKVIAEMKKESGIDLLTINEIVAGGGLVAGGPLPMPYFGAVIRFSAPYDQKAIVAGTKGQAQEVDYQGKKYWKIAQNDRCLHFVDATTILLGTEQGIKEMLDAKPGDTSPLIETLKSTSFDNDLTAVVMIDQNQVAQWTKMAPQEAQLMLAPVRNMKSITLQADLSGSTLMSLSVKMADPSAATGLKQLLGQIPQWKAIKDPNEIKKHIQQGELPEQLQAEVTPLLVDLASGLNVEVQGDTASLVLKAPDKFAERVDAAAPKLIAAAKEARATMIPMNNMRQIMIALHNYHDVNNHLPPPVIRSADGKPLYSWRVAILPYLEQAAMYDQFNKEEPWDSETNKKFLERIPPQFACGASPTEGKTNVLAVVGENGPWDTEGKGFTIAQITDGTANTVCVVQVSLEKAVPWTKPSDFDVDPADIAAGLGLKDQPRFLVGMMDGTVTFLSKSIKPETLKALFTRNGREEIDPADLKPNASSNK